MVNNYSENRSDMYARLNIQLPDIPQAGYAVVIQQSPWQLISGSYSMMQSTPSGSPAPLACVLCAVLDCPTILSAPALPPAAAAAAAAAGLGLTSLSAATCTSP